MPAPPAPPNATEIIAAFGLPYLEVYNGRTLVNVAIAFIVIDTVFVALRFLCRRLTQTRLNWGDLYLVLGFIFCVCLCAQCFALINFGGMGYHIQRIMVFGTPNNLVVNAKWLVIGPIFYSCAVLFSKLAILDIYLRFFTERTYRIVTYLIVFIQVGTCFGVIVADLVQCVPLRKVWDPTISGHCPVDGTLLFRWASFPNIITDIVMLLLPIPYLWKLPTSLEVKASLAATLSIGSIGLITSIVRFDMFFHSSSFVDGTWSAARLLSLTVVEPSIYLMSAVLLTLRPLYIRLRRRLIGHGLSTNDPSSQVGTIPTSRPHSYVPNSPSTGYATLKEVKDVYNMDAIAVKDQRHRTSIVSDISGQSVKHV